MNGIPNPQWLFFESIDNAKAAQKEMAKKVLLEDAFNKPIEFIGGMDVSNTPFDPEQMIFGATIVCSYPSLSILQKGIHANKQTFPYVPGLLGFREVPTLIQAYNQLSLFPDVIMVDGHGVSHPRGLGIASHVGVLLDIPTMGVAKSILVGTPATPLSEEVGSMVPLLWKGKEIAMMVRTKKRCSPLIISAGHKITLKTAVQLVMSCLKKYRLPEPTRYAHLAANEIRRSFLNLKSNRPESGLQLAVDGNIF
jgi:deoxyribonuclease V